MTVDTQEMMVFELTEAIIPFIESQGYSKGYLAGLRHAFNRLNQFCTENGETQFSTELGQRFLEECYGVKRGTISRAHSREHRAMDMLSDFQQFGVVMLRRRLERKFPPQFSGQVQAYFCKMQREHMRENTIKSHKKTLYRLTDFLDGQGVKSTSEITLEILNRYIKMTLCNYSKDIVRLHLGIMRKFLKFLFDCGELADDLSGKLMNMRFSSTPTHLPPTFTEEEIEHILSTVDRESPAGKRDYAVLMLAAKLGLRTSDIRNLKYENIDWEHHTIRLSQVKTNEMLVLPLPSDVGWALIDYIRHGRPESDAPEIFLRAVAPYVSLQNFDNILIKHMRMADIPLERVSHHGLHALRHSLATHMLEQEIPIHVIQEVLGHVNAQTTERYTAIDVRQLKTCALEVPAI